MMDQPSLVCTPMVRHLRCPGITPLLLALAALGTLGCAGSTPAPAALRGREFPLVRIDGQRVHGAGAVVEAPDSHSAAVDCRDRVADGSLLITRNGRGFIYRSTMRSCDGTVLVTETNEGRVEGRASGRDSTLRFIIDRSSGATAFRGEFSDSIIRIYELGGLLEFALRDPVTAVNQVDHGATQ